MKTCSKCGETKPLDEFYNRPRPRAECKVCMLLADKIMKTLRNANGKCRRHGDRNVAPNSTTRCIECCWEVANRKSRTGLTIEEANTIIEQQNYICSLSGKALIKGINASADHIIPKNKGGINGIGNIRYLDKYINYARCDKTDEEFIQMCRDVVEHQDRRKNENLL